MSDPVTNIEIEDVLSSIRRLVTDEGRSGSRTQESGGRVPATKLVLTPALRVSDDGAPVAQNNMRSSDTANAPLRLDETYAATDYVDEIEFRRKAAVSDKPEIADDEDVDNLPADDGQPPWANPETTLHQAAADFDPESDEGSGHRPQIDADEESKSEQTALNPIETWGETAVSEPSGGIADAGTGHDGEPNIGGRDYVADMAPEQPTSDAAPDSATEVLSRRADTLSTKIQALEAAIAQQQDQWEPDSAGEDDYAGMPIREPIPWQDHEPEQVVVPPRSESEPLSQEVSSGELTGEDTVIDEETLKELVADIVRQELQGALGERITRNVRKLVRREIQRALAAQNMD